jgi:DegV family protein with EDD domain
MPGVRIVTDSASDLSKELAEAHGITVVPLTIRFGEEELVDQRDINPAEFWQRCKSSSVLPETAAPSPGAFQEAFAAAAAAGYDGVVCLTLSSKLSATYQSALAAAETMGDPEVAVIDTESVTMGEGLLVLIAAESAAAGASVSQIVAETKERLTRIHVYGAIDTLEHLQKGGRIGGAAALLGSLLSIKPVIQVLDGKVEQESKQRTRSRSLEYLADKVRADQPLERLAVCTGAAGDLDVLMAKLEGLEIAPPPVVVDLGPVVGTHAGPGTIGVCYLTQAGA